MTVSRILAAKGRDVITTQPRRTLGEASEILVAKNIGAVVVTDDQGSVHGILSERDILRAFVKHGADVFKHPVSAHMTTPLVATTEDESVQTVMEKMTNERSRHIPVIRNANLVGLVSIGDIIKYRLGECEYEHAAMREYIASP
jgi:CBS domain-containing protein